MRLLIGSRIELTKIGGVATVVRTLAAGCVRLGDEVTLLKPGNVGPEQLAIDGVAYHRMALRNMLLREHKLRGVLSFAAHLPSSLVRLASLIHAHRIQVVNAHYFDDAWFYLIALRRVMGYRLVISVHGDDVRGAAAGDNLRLLRRWAADIDRLVFCSTGFLDEVLPASDPLRRKAAVILNGVDVDVPPVGMAGREERLVCVAHLFDRKGVDVLIDAFALIASQYPRLTLVIVGDGPERSNLEGRAHARGIRERLVFCGSVKRSEALTLIGSSRVFCLASRREPFGLVLAEAMALGTPIVATRTGGIPEVVREDVDALLVGVDDAAAFAAALIRVLDNQELAGRLAAAAAQRWRSHLTSDTFVDEYRRLFKSLVPAKSVGFGEGRAFK